MELGRGFEADLRDALLEDVEARMAGESDNLTHEFVQAAHDRLREYGQRHDYDVGPIIDSLGQPEVTRSSDGVSVRLEWDHEAAVYMELGTPKHRVEGNPILSFVWEQRHDPPEWVQEEFEREGDGWRVFLPETNPEGLPEGRWIRDSLRHLRQVMSA